MCFEYLRKKFNIVSLYDAPYPKENNPKLYTIPTELRQAFYNRYFVTDPEWFTIHVGIKIGQTSTGCPAESINDVITFKPNYACVPVLAHEICHSLYSKLTDAQKHYFQDLLSNLVPQNKMMELAIRDYNRAKDWATVPICESHAQLFRFFGKSLPTELYEFYQYLI